MLSITYQHAVAVRTATFQWLSFYLLPIALYMYAEISMILSKFNKTVYKCIQMGIRATSQKNSGKPNQVIRPKQ